MVSKRKKWADNVEDSRTSILISLPDSPPIKIYYQNNSISKSSEFDNKNGKWPFCDTPLSWSVFDLTFLRRISTACANKLKAAIISHFLKDKVMVALVFFRNVISVTSVGQNEKIEKAGFQFVGWCMINIESNNNTQMRT